MGLGLERDQPVVGGPAPTARPAEGRKQRPTIGGAKLERRSGKRPASTPAAASASTESPPGNRVKTEYASVRA